MNSFNELVSYGINEYTARSMIEAYKSRIGTENGDYTITDVEYQHDTGERKVTQVCRRCGSVNIRFLKCGRDKFSDLRQRCDCIEKDRKLKEKEDRYYAELKRKEEERSKKCEEAVWHHLEIYENQLKKEHSVQKERLYYVWAGMKQRCSNPKNTKYQYYGGRGITVCKEWLKYKNFRDWAYSAGYDPLAPFGECTIDRIDVNGNYEPDNCRWVDVKTQNMNQRPRKKKCA